MSLSRTERIILYVNLLAIPYFAYRALTRENFEFLMYIGVILVALSLLLWQQHKIKFPISVLVGLTLWGILHMAGGTVPIGAGVLYELILYPIFPTQGILRYDQLVHAFGFGVATLVCLHVLRKHIHSGPRLSFGLSALVVFMGMGLGALNEIIEFVAVLAFPETGVGGYENTLWDLVFNSVGAVAAVTLARAGSA